jgi:hypothetical protein
VSQIGLVTLIDVMVGLETDDRALARLAWVSPFNDEQQALFEYFMGLACANIKRVWRLRCKTLGTIGVERALNLVADGVFLFCALLAVWQLSTRLISQATA